MRSWVTSIGSWIKIWIWRLNQLILGIGKEILSRSYHLLSFLFIIPIFHLFNYFQNWPPHSFFSFWIINLFIYIDLLSSRAISKDDESIHSYHRHSHYHKTDNQDHAHGSSSYRFLSRGRRDSNKPPQRYCGNRLFTALNGACGGKGHQGTGCPDKVDIRPIRQRRDGTNFICPFLLEFHIFRTQILDFYFWIFREDNIYDRPML